VPLTSETEGPRTLEEQERNEWVHARLHVTKDFHSQSHNKRQGSKRFTEFETMETFRRFREVIDFHPLHANTDFLEQYGMRLSAKSFAMTYFLLKEPTFELASLPTGRNMRATYPSVQSSPMGISQLL
jgi:hypothetical protein